MRKSVLPLGLLTRALTVAFVSMAGCNSDQPTDEYDAGSDARTDAGLDAQALQGVWELAKVPALVQGGSCTIGVERCLTWEFTGDQHLAQGRLFNSSGPFLTAEGELSITDESVTPSRQMVTSWRVDGDVLYTGVLTPSGTHTGLVGTWSSRDTESMPAPSGSTVVLTSLELKGDGTYSWTLPDGTFSGTYTASETSITLTGDGPVIGDLEIHDGWLWGAPYQGAKFERP
ncbi:MAG: lipocalin family protein [Kofleriaceae bacterium]